MVLKDLIGICCVGMLLSCSSGKKNMAMTKDNDSLFLIVGSYASVAEEGLHVCQFNETDGGTALISSLKGISNPSYQVISANGDFIYSVGEDEGESSSVNALSFDKREGVLKLLNSQPAQGGAPCYINLDKENRFVVTANYLGGSVSVFPLKKDGTLLPASQVIGFSGKGLDEERQSQPHLHCVCFSPDGKNLFADDLGTDKIYKFEVLAQAHKDTFLVKGNPKAYSVESGSGPRHLCFHPNGRYAYLINELSGKVTSFKYDNGNLESFQYISSDSLGVSGSGDIHIRPDGKFLYSSNRLKADGLAIFAIDSLNGELTKVGYQLTGLHLRNFVITPSGKFLLVACRDSDLIQVFEIDEKTGLLNDTKKGIKISKPVCLKFISK